MQLSHYHLCYILLCIAQFKQLFFPIHSGQGKSPQWEYYEWSQGRTCIQFYLRTQGITVEMIKCMFKFLVYCRNKDRNNH